MQTVRGPDERTDARRTEVPGRHELPREASGHSGPSAPDERVVQEDDHDGSDRRDDDRRDVDPGDVVPTGHCTGDEPTNDGADDPEKDAADDPEPFIPTDEEPGKDAGDQADDCLLYTSPSPRD